MGFREFQEIRGFRGLNSRLRVVDGVDCVYGVSIRVNVNDGNDVGTDRAICPRKTSIAPTHLVNGIWRGSTECQRPQWVVLLAWNSE